MSADCGHLGTENRPDTWGADGRIDAPLGILSDHALAYHV